MAGMAATVSIAKSAASIINFFNFFSFSSAVHYRASPVGLMLGHFCAHI
jgi:hypothetical protein